MRGSRETIGRTALLCGVGDERESKARECGHVGWQKKETNGVGVEERERERETEAQRKDIELRFAEKRDEKQDKKKKREKEINMCLK